MSVDEGGYRYVGELFRAWDYEDSCDPYDDIAEFLRLPPHHVSNCFDGLHIATWADAAHLSVLAHSTRALNKLENHLVQAIKAMRALHPDDIESLLGAGCPTIQQLDKFVLVLRQEGDDKKRWASQFDRRGGLNPGADLVAEGIRRVFRRNRWKITYGQKPDSDEPSTDFCRAVQYAIGSFGIVAGWRGPAQRSYNKQASIDNRLFRIHQRTRNTESHTK